MIEVRTLSVRTFFIFCRNLGEYDGRFHEANF